MKMCTLRRDDFRMVQDGSGEDFFDMLLDSMGYIGNDCDEVEFYADNDIDARRAFNAVIEFIHD